MKRIFIILFLCIFLKTFITAQQPFVQNYVISSAGDFFKNNNTQVSWSLGETITEFGINEATKSSFSQGFQQYFQLSAVYVNEIEDNYDNSIVYPNPVLNVINIKIENDFEFKIYDVFGKLLINKKIFQNGNKQIDISYFKPGLYFIEIYRNNKIKEYYKVIKIN